MAILVDENTRYLIQGITGKQGSRALREMLLVGSKVLCGVTPGKGGQEVEGVEVFGSVKDALASFEVDCSLIMVPPKFAKGAIVEAIEAGVKLINVVTENIPVHDMALCIALARKNDCRIIGATSTGIYSVGKSKCGPIGSGKSKIAFSSGSVGVISRSGGMSCETSLVLTQAGLGQSTVVSTGSDVLMGSDFVDVVKLFERDDETKGIVLFGEIGSRCEEDLASYLISKGGIGKPIVAFISGKFARGIENVSLGHAGAIVENGVGSRDVKVKALVQAGVRVVDVHHEIGKVMKELLGDKSG
jgi:succinyl-CoA synthetase alpha subunit